MGSCRRAGAGTERAAGHRGAGGQHLLRQQTAHAPAGARDADPDGHPRNLPCQPGIIRAAGAAGQGHAALKEMAIEAVDGMLAPIRERLEQTSAEQAKSIARLSAAEAREIASKTLARVLAALG